MKIIVTGGAGFIASHVTDAYVKAGHRVVAIDNLSTGFKKNVNPKAKFYRADIRNPKTMEKIFAREKPEILNHHAAIASVVESVRNPVPTLETNIMGTANLLISFGKHGRGARKMIFSSTGGAIYGNPKKVPVPEQHSLDPLSPYGLSKKIGEELIAFYGRELKFDYIIFRYPNLYGSRQNLSQNGIVPLFAAMMRRGERPVIFGDGTKARDYTHVADIAAANVMALHRGKNEILNLGWGKPVSDRQMFDAIAREIGFKKPPVYAPYRKGEVYKVALDSRRAKKILGWKPAIKLQNGVRMTVADTSRHA